MTKDSNKPNVLVIGGCGFIGRNLVRYLVKNNLCNHIKVVDKVVMGVAFLSEEDKKVFGSKNVKFKQANAKSKESLSKAWRIKGGGSFDYVFNFASETNYNLPEEVYKENIIDIVNTVISVAKEREFKRIFDVSTSQIYESGKKKSTESSKIKPWTTLAEYKLKSEELWLKSGLPVIIVRPSVVYGPGDVYGIMPRLTIGRVYQHTRKRMNLLWGADLKVNTVHVLDVCRALWHLSSNGTDGSIYNLSDHGDTNQGKLNELIESIFGIKTGFVSAVKCKFAKIYIQRATTAVNDKHLKPWAELSRISNLHSSPISPYISPELLYDHHLSVDGSMIEKETGFEYKHKQIEKELLEEMINYWADQNAFPRKDIESNEKYDDDDDDDDDDDLLEEEMNKSDES